MEEFQQGSFTRSGLQRRTFEFCFLFNLFCFLAAFFVRRPPGEEQRYLDTVLNLDWSDIFGKVAITCFLLAFIIFLIVGWAHGGKHNMFLWDPALKNKISPLGIKCLIGGGILILLAILFGIISTLLI